jgi:hypothetical protein
MEKTRIDSGVCEFALADHGAAEQHECHVQAGIALVADPQSAQVVQPGEGALHDPAFLAEPRTVLGVAPGDHGLHAAFPKLAAVLVVVIAPVGEYPISALSGTPGLAGHRPNAVDERQ